MNIDFINSNTEEFYLESYTGATINSTYEERFNTLQLSLIQIKKQLSTITNLTMNNVLRSQSQSSNNNAISINESHKNSHNNSNDNVVNNSINNVANSSNNLSRDNNYDFEIHKNNIKNLLRKRTWKQHHKSSFGLF